MENRVENRKKKQQVMYIHGGESFLSRDIFRERLKTKGLWDLPSADKKVKWTDTLAQDLGEDYEVFMPKMPNRENAAYEEWKIWFERHFEYLLDEVVLIGCSLGAMFLAKYLIENETPFTIKALILMAGVVVVEDFSSEDCGDFLVYPEKASILVSRAKKVSLWHSKDDFLVPYEHSVLLHKNIPNSTLVTLEDKNHFLVSELPELVASIKALG